MPWHLRLNNWNIYRITRMQRCQTHWPLSFQQLAIVISEPTSCKQRVVFSLWLSPELASTVNKINVRERYHCQIISPSFSSNPFHNIWIRWMTTVGHVCIAASLQSLGNRSSSSLLQTERLYAASTSPLIHHCLFPFPPHIYRGLHSWPSGKTD